MKNLILILTLAFASCETQTPNPSPERRADPMSGGNGQTIQYPQSDFNITWDSTWNCSQTLLTWTDFGADKYYILFEGTGNISCPNTYNVAGVTYYYPWTTYTDQNRIALLSGQICGTLPLHNYNIIVRYYKFRQGRWYEYNSLPVNVALGSNNCN